MNLCLLIFVFTSFTSYKQHANATFQVEKPDYVWSKCYENLGCLNNTEDWYDAAHRPITARPLARHIIKTTFYYFGKTAGMRGVTAEQLVPKAGQIKGTSFDRNSKTHLLIHDFTSSGLAGWIRHVASSILSVKPSNVISVDWTAGAEPPYAIAVQNARVVALEISCLLRLLIDGFQIHPSSFHLIGQGVGAHIAGYASEDIAGIGRITGLDPNGLYFSGMPTHVRLDKTDARFVDVIHTDVDQNYGQGMAEAMGHVDFYPNGGREQPGCGERSLKGSLAEIKRDELRQDEVVPGCEHKRAGKYFTASIREADGCEFVGYLCPEYRSFLRGECLECLPGRTCATMGYPGQDVPDVSADLTDASFYLDTNAGRPFCLFAYKVKITIGSDNISDKTSRYMPSGIFCITIYSESEDLMFRTNLNMGPSEKRFIIGENVYLTYQKGPRLLHPDRVVLRFDSDERNATISVSRVLVVSMPVTSETTIPLCGRRKLIKFAPGAQEEFLPCRTRCRKNEINGGKSGASNLANDVDRDNGYDDRQPASAPRRP